MVDTKFICTANSSRSASKNLPPRLLRHFFALSTHEISDEGLSTIYTSLLSSLPSSSKKLVDVVNLGIELHNKLKSSFKRPMLKSYCKFTPRDLSRVFDSIRNTILSNDLEYQDTSTIYRLWCHEFRRAYCDRFIDSEDRILYSKIIKDLLKSSKDAEDINGEENLLFAFKREG